MTAEVGSRVREDATPQAIADVMTPHPVTIRKTADLRDAAEVVAYTRVSDLMVVEEGRRFVGVLSEGDILRAAMPPVDDILAEGGTLENAFDIFLNRGRSLAGRSIEPLIIREPITVRPDDHVAEAATIFVDLQIRLLPVVEGGLLLGTVSRADVCRGVVGLP